MKGNDNGKTRNNDLQSSAFATSPASPDTISAGEVPVPERNQSYGKATVPSPTPSASTEDVDIQRLWISPDFEANLGVKKQLVTVQTRRPKRHEWLRLRNDPEYQRATFLLVYKEERDETYVVDRPLWSELSDELAPYMLFVATTRQGAVFLLPVPLPGVDGRTNSWHESLRAAAEIAKTRWVRIASNVPAGAYDVFVSSVEWDEPEWPDMSFDKLVGLAFKGKVITSADHPVVLRIKGQR